MSTPHGPVEHETDEAHCPGCGADMTWEPCPGKNGKPCDGTINCLCEGMEGSPTCPEGCDA